MSTEGSNTVRVSEVELTDQSQFFFGINETRRVTAGKTKFNDVGT